MNRSTASAPTIVTRSREVLDRLFAWKVRGVRWIEIIGVALVAVMIFSVYVAKAGAAREGAQIAELEREIAENGQRVRLLRAEAARLENPARLEALSRHAGLAPVGVDQQAGQADLARLSPRAEPVAAAPVPAPSSEHPFPQPTAAEQDDAAIDPTTNEGDPR